MEPLRFDVNLTKLPATIVTDGTVCPHCGDARVIVASKMIEVQPTGSTRAPEFALATARICKGCRACL